MSRPCYVYGLYDKGECKIRYIGVSLNPKKRFVTHKYCDKKDHLKKYHIARWVSKCKELRMKILFTGTEDECYALEVKLIAKYKNKRKLTNMSAGGEKPYPTYLYGGANGRSIAVLQYTLGGEFIKEFSSCQEAGDSIGVHRSSISDCVNGYTKKSGGYIWRKK